jgi:hypothetical protein
MAIAYRWLSLHVFQLAGARDATLQLWLDRRSLMLFIISFNFSGWPRLFFDLPTLRVIFFGED